MAYNPQLPNIFVCSGSPNSQLAGNAWTGAGGPPPDMAWDGTNNLLYVCTTTGTTSTAVWSALAPLTSPTFAGVPAVPTAAPGTSTTQAASTAFVQAALASGASYQVLSGGVAGGSANALTVTTGHSIATLTGTSYMVVFRTGASANSSAATLAVDSTAATAIQLNGAALTSGNLAANTTYAAVFDGTYWQLVGGSGGSSSGITALASLVNDTMDTVYAQGVTGTRQLRYNGFVDNFVDTTGIDSVNSTAVYDPTNQWYQSGNAASSFIDHFDNFSGAFVDSSSNAYLMTPTGVQTWTGFSKFGSGCAQFDGSTSKLTGPNGNASYKFAGDLCLEGWAWANALPANNLSEYIFDTRNGASDAGFGFCLQNTSGTQQYYVASNTWGLTFTNTGQVVANKWFHWAVVRSGSTVTLYIDGTSAGSGSRATNWSDGYLSIGAYNSGSSYFNGYMDCFRIVNGSPVYTSNFTPSTTALTAITNTTLLLQFDGSLTDTSTSGLTITNTNTALTPVPKIGTGCANFGVANAANYMTAPGSIGALGAGNWTIEGKYWPYTNAANAELVDTRASTASAAGLGIYLDTAGKLNFITNNVSTTASSAHTLNAWNDFAVIKNGTTVTLYLNGNSVGTVSNSATFTDANLFIGRLASAASTYFPGWMDELRISNIARQTGNYTPSTTAFVSDANTLLLLHFDSLNNDVSTNLVPISFYGAPHANPKFGVACARFDNSASYLSGPSGNAALKYAGDCTFEGLFNFWSVSGTQILFNTASTDNNGTSINLYFSGGIFYLDISGHVINGIGATALAGMLGRWAHVALVRSGSTWTLYIDGTSVGTGSSAANLSDGYCRIGRNSVASAYLAAYVDEVRWSNSARYNTNFTPSASAFTNDGNTSLLLHFDGGATPFIDSSSNNLTITNNGSPGVICVAPKFGTGAMWFDGSTNYARGLSGPWCEFSGALTFDCRVFPTSYAAKSTIFDTRASAASSTGIQLFQAITTGYLTVFTNNAAAITQASGAMTLNTWNHVALVRNGSTLALYLNGVSVNTATVSANLSDGLLSLGSDAPSAANYYAGFIDEFRVLNGTAAWTTEFSVPTLAYTNNITLQTVAYTVGTGSPTTATAIIKLYDITGGSTLGTDIVAAISLDNGSHWTNASTYVDNGAWDTTGTYRIISAVFSGITTGSQPIFKLTTANQKIFRIKAEAVYWS